VRESVQSLLEIVHMLVLKGADMNALNSRNRTAFDDFMDIQHEFNVQPLIQMTGSLLSLLKPGPTGQLPHPHHTQPLPPARDTPPPATAAQSSWFAKVFGFEEKDGGHTGTFDFVRSQLSLTQNALGAFVFTTPRGKQLWAGRFTHESLSNLHGKLQASGTLHVRQHACLNLGRQATHCPPPLTSPPTPSSSSSSRVPLACSTRTKSCAAMCPCSYATPRSAARCSK
jgi:hypothetical protein